MGKTNSKSLSLLSLGLVCALGVLGSIRFASKGFETNAVTVQTERRIYAYLQGDWTDDRMFIYYFGGSGYTGPEWTACPEMTQVINDYWTGMFYYDIPVNATTFCVKKVSGNVSKLSDQSVDIQVSDLFVGSNYKAAAIGAWVDDLAKRTFTAADTAGGNDGQIAAILNNINSCTSSYASGYNAWPQINDLFILPSTLNGATVVTDNFGPDTTITDKCNYLQTRYTIDQAS